jgi:NitT/TauT family transport system substrate-binding protein
LNACLTRRRVLQAGLAVSTVATAGLVLPRKSRADGTAFTFVTPFSLSLAFASPLYAKAAGFYAKEGLDVTIYAARGAEQAANLVAAGQAQAARTGGGNFIASVVKSNAPLISIATIAQISPFSVISSDAKPIRRIADLAGKTLGLASLGGSMENTLDLVLLKAKLDRAGVQREKVADGPGSFGLIEAGRIDGFLASVSTTVRLKRSGAKIAILPVDDGIPGQVYVATPDMVAKSKDTLVRFLRATRKAALAIADAKDLDPILAGIGGVFEVPGIDDRDTAREDLRGNLDLWLAKGRDNLLRNVPEAWAAGIAGMTEAGFIDPGVDAAKLYTNEIWDAASSG